MIIDKAEVNQLPSGYIEEYCEGRGPGGWRWSSIDIRKQEPAQAISRISKLIGTIIGESI